MALYDGMVMKMPQFAGKAASLEGRVEDAEPAREVLLDRQFRLELRLQLQLLGVVAPLVLSGRDEGPEGAALVAVDPVDGVLTALEAKHRGQELRAEPLFLEPLCHRVHGGDLVLELRIADDDPGEAELVLLALELRARVGRDSVE